MKNSTKEAMIPKNLLITVCILNIPLWMALLFYGLFLGGSPGPGYERTVSIAYVGVMVLGFMGAVIGLIGIALKKKSTLFTAAVLGAAGSVPLFLLELPAAGIVFLLIGTMPLLELLK